MTEFKVGDRVKLKYFKSKEEYNSQANGLRCWDYINFIHHYDRNKNKVYTIIDFDSDGQVVSESITDYWPFQIEKAYSLKDKLALIKELIK
jgi:hypothetical protein